MKKEKFFMLMWLGMQIVSLSAVPVSSLKELALKKVIKGVVARLASKGDITTRLQRGRDYLASLPLDVHNDVAACISTACRKDVSLHIPLASRPGLIVSLNIDQGRNRLLAGFHDKVFLVYDMHTGALISQETDTPELDAQDVLAVDKRDYVSSNFLIAVYNNHRIKLRLPSTPQPIIFTAHQSPIANLCINHAGTLMTVVEDNGLVIVLNLLTQQQEIYWQHLKKINEILFSHANILVCTDNDGGIFFWDPSLPEGQQLFYYKAKYPINALCFHPSQQKLITADATRAITIWHIDHLDSISIELFALCREMVSSLVMSCQGSLLIGGCKDGMVRAWDFIKGGDYVCLPGHISEVTTLACAQDSFISSDLNGTLYVWPLPEKFTLEQLFFVLLFKLFKEKKLYSRGLTKEQFLSSATLSTFKPLIRNYIRQQLNQS